MNCCVTKNDNKKKCLNKSTRLYNYKFYCKIHFNKKIKLLSKRKVKFNILNNKLYFI